MTGRYVVGVGLASAATLAELSALVHAALAEAGIGPDAITAVATIDTRRHHPAVAALGALAPVVAFPAAALAPAAVPASGDRPPHPAVAESAALRAAGEGATLVLRRRKGPRSTVAVARVADGSTSTSEAANTADGRPVRHNRRR